MNYKKWGLAIIGAITVVLIEAKNVFAQTAIDISDLQYMEQTGYGMFSPPPLLTFFEYFRNFVFFPIIIIVWLVGLIRYIRRRKNHSQLSIDPATYKRQLIRLVVWSVILILIFLEAYFVENHYYNNDFGPYDIQNLPNAIALFTTQMVGYLFIFLIIPKIIIKTFLYFKGKRNVKQSFNTTNKL